MTHKNNFKTLGLFGLSCCSFSYGADNNNNQEARVLQLLTQLSQPQTKGLKDAVEKGFYGAASQLTTKCIIELFSTINKGTWEILSRTKTTLEKDSPLTCAELAVINQNIYNSLLPYFNASPVDATKEKRAAAIKDEINELDSTENESIVIDAHSWINKRFVPEFLIKTYLDMIIQAREKIIQKIQAQKELSTLATLFYTAKNSSKVKQHNFDIIPAFTVIEHCLTMLLQIVENTQSEKELIAAKNSTRFYCIQSCNVIESYVKLEGGAEELEKLRKINLKFSKPGDSASQTQDLLAAMEKNSQ